MSPRTKEQYSKIRETSRNHIAEAALQLFAKHGYHATSISQIASKAKISKGLLYNYFKNKDDLLKSIIEEGLNEILIMTKQMNAGKNGKERLSLLIELSVEHLKRYTAFWDLFISLLLQPDVQKKTGAIITQYRDEAVGLMTELFKQMGSEHPQLEAFTLGTQLDGIGLNYVAAPDKFPIDEMKDYLIEKYCK
jgi:AcrR family transcriptional regulator